MFLFKQNTVGLAPLSVESAGKPKIFTCFWFSISAIQNISFMICLEREIAKKKKKDTNVCIFKFIGVNKAKSQEIVKFVKYTETIKSYLCVLNFVLTHFLPIFRFYSH